MDKVYEPRDIEQRLYGEWESRGYFAPQGAGTPYCIMIPPPNVTGTLHMGHAFQDTIMDALIRYHRMRGDARCGRWAPTTPASPRRWWWNGSSMPPDRAAPSWAARPS